MVDLTNLKLSRRHLFILLALISIFFLGFTFPGSNYGIVAPEVYITDLSLPKRSFNLGEEIKGEFAIWNAGQALVSDLYLRFKLLDQPVSGVPTRLIDTKTSDQAFSLLSDEKSVKSFTYTLPGNLTSGDYTFRIQLISGEGGDLGWEDKIITMKESGNFIALSNHHILKNGEKLSPGLGVYYQKKELPAKIVLDAKNETNASLSAIPKIITYKRDVGKEIANETSKNPIIFNPKEKKKLEYDLPLFDKAETYVSEFRLYDTNNNPLSNIVLYRWIISGADAEILYLEIDKDSYQRGETAKVDVTIAGPGDYRVKLGKGILEVEILNEKQQVVGEVSQEIDLVAAQLSLTVPITSSVINPSVKATIRYQGSILDVYTVKIETKTVSEIPPEGLNRYLGLGLGLITLIITIILIWRIKFKKPLSLFLFLIGLGIILGKTLLFVSPVLAVTEVCSGPEDGTTIVWNKPLPGQIFNPNGNVTFKGKVRVTSCGNGLKCNRVVFWITDKNGFTTKLKPTTTLPCETYDPDSICVINEKSNPKRYKFGVIYPPDQDEGGGPYWVEWNETFSLSKVPFSGKVRFYVEYRGTHWAEHWHWMVAYQEGEIVPPPTCTLTANPSSGTAPLSGTLTWTTTNSPTSCTASGSWSGSKSVPSESQGYGPLNTAGTYTYNLSCSNAGGTGTCSTTVTVSWPPGGTLEGTIWKDFDNVGESCFEDPQGGNYAESPITVSYTPCEPYDPNYYLPGGQCTKVTNTGDYQFNGVPLSGPSYGVSINGLLDPWFCTHGCNCIGITVPDNNEANFGVTDNPLPWIQGVNGDIYGNGISVEVPSKASCNDSDVCVGYNRWFLDASPGPTATYPGGGVVISGNPALTCGGGGSGRCSRRPDGNNSEPGWTVKDEAMDWPSLPTLTPVGSPPWGNLQPGRVYSRTPPFSPPGSYDLTGPGVAVVYIQNGYLRFQTNFISDAPDDEGVIFVVENGQAIINQNVRRIDALILVINGTIRVRGTDAANNLTVRGMLYAEGGFNFERTLENNRIPAVVARYNPLYLYYPSPLLKPRIFWREVAP